MQNRAHTWSVKESFLLLNQLTKGYEGRPSYVWGEAQVYLLQLTGTESESISTECGDVGKNRREKSKSKQQTTRRQNYTPSGSCGAIYWQYVQRHNVLICLTNITANQTGGHCL